MVTLEAGPTGQDRTPTPLGAWLMAARPATLSAAVAPVVIGTAMAAYRGVAEFLPAAAALTGALLIQIATNLANDYYDYKKGGDGDDRIGPTRVVQAGILTGKAVGRATVAVVALSILVGAYLVWVGGTPILVIGVLALISGIAYTGGPFPLAYHGLGELFAFVFFGLVAVSGTYWVQARNFEPSLLLAGAGIGAMTTALLVTNNLRDIESDARAGKRTLAVRFGATATKGEFALLVLAAALVPPLGVVFFEWPAWTLLALFGLGPALRTVDSVLTYADPRELNPVLLEVARGVTWYGGLLALGFVLGSRL